MKKTKTRINKWSTNTVDAWNAFFPINSDCFARVLNGMEGPGIAAQTRSKLDYDKQRVALVITASGYECSCSVRQLDMVPPQAFPLELIDTWMALPHALRLSILHRYGAGSYWRWRSLERPLTSQIVTILPNGRLTHIYQKTRRSRFFDGQIDAKDFVSDYYPIRVGTLNLSEDQLRHYTARTYREPRKRNPTTERVIVVKQTEQQDQTPAPNQLDLLPPIPVTSQVAPALSAVPLKTEPQPAPVIKDQKPVQEGLSAKMSTREDLNPVHQSEKDAIRQRLYNHLIRSAGDDLDAEGVRFVDFWMGIYDGDKQKGERLTACLDASKKLHDACAKAVETALQANITCATFGGKVAEDLSALKLHSKVMDKHVDKRAAEVDHLRKICSDLIETNRTLGDRLAKLEALATRRIELLPQTLQPQTLQSTVQGLRVPIKGAELLPIMAKRIAMREERTDQDRSDARLEQFRQIAIDAAREVQHRIDPDQTYMMGVLDLERLV
jgi:hypothetical protein